VRAALESHPAVLAARSGVEERDAARRALEAGTYELNMRLAAANRRERATGQDLAEYELSVERGVRIGRKAELDAAIGREGVARARLAVEEAVHEAARALLRGWFEWLRAAEQGADWEAQSALLAQQLRAVEGRVRRGDAPPQERLLAESAHAQAHSQALLASARAGAAAAQLAAGFPGISVPAVPPRVALQALEGDLDSWRLRVLQRDPELAAARVDALRLRLGASRAEANRVPDPTLGVRLASERDAAERLVGFTLAVPFPGGARLAAADAAVAEAASAAQREAVVLRRLEAQSASLYFVASRSHDAARGAQEAAAGLRRNAELSERAYALGAANLAEVIAARRMALEAELAATLARLDAAEARYRLMLDAHELWAFGAP
jgi:outer membrane protein TolC